MRLSFPTPAFFAALALGFTTGCDSGPELNAPELIVLVSLDTLRADHLSLYGYGRETAPNLSRLAADGTVFRTTCAQSTQTLTSHKSMFTGKYPSRLIQEQTGATLDHLEELQDPKGFLVDTFIGVRGALAPALSAAGYRSVAFTDGGWMSREAGFAHGFDFFDDSAGGLQAIVPRVRRWLEEEAQARPALLFVHSYDVHCPYPCREPFNSSFCEDHTAHLDLDGRCGKFSFGADDLTERDLAAIADHYDGGIESADAWFGELIELLRERGEYEEALIVVTSDHGESLGEHGVVGHGNLYLEQLLVPLIVKPPASWGLAPGINAEPVQLVDLLPTLVEVAEAAPLTGIDGRSLLPLLSRKAGGRDHLLAMTTFEEAPLLVSNPAKRTILAPGRWQAIEDPSAGSVEFFDLAGDPGALEPRSELPAVGDVPWRDAFRIGQKGAPEGFRLPDTAELSSEKLDELNKLGYGQTQ